MDDLHHSLKANTLAPMSRIKSYLHNRPKLDFLIVGAEKAGTTALFAYLRQIPGVYIPFNKELNFFDRDHRYGDGKDFSPLHRWFLLAPKGALLGEATPTYLVNPHCFSRIYDYNPDIKVVALLRSPVRRAYSAWNYRRARLRDKRDFMTAVKVEVESGADITDTVSAHRTLSLLNGQEVVGFEITRSRGASEIDVGQGVLRVLRDIQERHQDLTLKEAFNFVDPVQEEFDASMALLYEGAALAVLVVWLFLRDFRATFIAAVALPLSAIPTFIGMYLFGFTLNVVSLLALSLVVGILVDDAIVEIENIVRHLRMGKSPYRAAMEAADEIGLAVVATTFALIAVFLPTAFMSGIVGRFFKQFGWTAAMAVFASLLVARLLTPMMAAYLLTNHQASEAPGGFLMPRYLQLVRVALNHRWATLAGTVAFFIGSLLLIPLLPQGFIPADDNPQTQVFIELPPGGDHPTDQ